MARLTLSISVFVLCFAFGTGLVPRVNEFGPGAFVKKEKPTVTLVEVRTTEDGLEYRFVVTNRSELAYRYYTWGPEHGIANPAMEFNGERDKRIGCGTGLKEAVLSPGESVTMSFIPARSLPPGTGRLSRFRVGYHIGTRSDGVSFTVWSDEIVLAENISGNNRILTDAKISVRRTSVVHVSQD